MADQQKPPSAPQQQSQKEAQAAAPEKKEPKPKKSWNYFVTIFLVLAGISVMLMIVIGWQMQQYTAYQVQKDSIQSTLLGETDVTQEQVSELESGFIEEDSVITFIESIESARPYFEEFTINFVSDVPEGNKAPRYLPVNFTLTGSYKNIDTFLEGLLSAPYVVRIRRLDISSTEAFSGKTRLSLSAELYVSEEFSKK